MERNPIMRIFRIGLPALALVLISGNSGRAQDDSPLPPSSKPRDEGITGAGEGPAWHRIGNLFFTGGDRITFGSTVLLEDESGKEVRYQIVGSDEVDPTKGRISIMAPLARTLIGKRVGDHVTAQLPAGKKTFDVLEVNFPWPAR